MRKKFFVTFAALFASFALLLGLYACGTSEYEIKFAGEDGTELLTVTVEKGEVPVFTGEAPTKAADVQYTYTFAGWSDGETTYAADKLPAAEKDVTYKAVFTGTVKSYTVTWHVEGETTASSVNYGEKAVYSGTPAKQPTVDKAYTFAGWAAEENGTAVLTEAQLTVTGDVDLYAVFTEGARTYTITFLDDDGTELSASAVAYGEVPVYSGTPAKAKTPQYTYTFAGWLDEEGTLYGPAESLIPVEGDATYTAQYTSTINAYTVTWHVGTVTTTTTHNYGTAPSYGPSDPTKADDEDYSYDFDGWATSEGGTKLNSLPTVEADAEYFARFAQVTRRYTVTWSVNGTTTTDRFTKNTVPAWKGEEPQKQQDAQYTYTFDGWATSEGGEKLDPLPAITGDVTYYARFISEVRSYTITFKVEGQQDYTVEVQYGDRPAYKTDTDTEPPAKAQTVSTVYTFTGWSDGAEETVYTKDTLPEVTGEATYTAVFAESARPYTITVKFYEGLEGETQFNNMEDKTFTLCYGTILTEENTEAFTAQDKSGTHYLPNMFRIGGIVTGDKTYEVRYTEADTWDGSSVSDHLDGTGNSAEDPFLIKSAADLKYLADESNKDRGIKDAVINYGAGKYYKLTKSIDLGDYAWTPICYNVSNGAANEAWRYFQGTFDGCGYTIAGLNFNDNTKNGVGLFGGIGDEKSVEKAEVKNLIVQGKITSKTRAGGLAYIVNAATISNIKTFVDITLNAVTNEVYSGGIFGTTTKGTSTFTNLESYGTIDSTGKRVGGIIGNTGGGTTVNITDCTNYSNVTASTHAGGIIGQADDVVKLTGCVNYGNMTAATTVRAGGMVATQSKAGSTFTNCKNYGAISSPKATTSDAATGGILGISTGATLTGCENYGEVNAPFKAGGIVGGATSSNITNCTNYGDVKGDNTAGGISGSAKTLTVSGCTNYGEVSGNQRVGGICGETITVDVTECTNYGDVKGSMTASDSNKGFAGIVGWTTTTSHVTKCTNNGNVEGNTNTGGICGYLGAGSTCPVEGEDANTNTGKVTGNSAYHDLIGYNANAT